MTDIKPVAWLCTPSAGGRPDATCRTDSRDDYVRFGRTITNLYPQSAIDALRAEVDGLTAQNERLSAYTVIHGGVLRYCGDGMRDAYSEMKVRAERAEAEVERLRADAERYHWLRDRIAGSEQIEDEFVGFPGYARSEEMAPEIDGSIDAARAAGEGGE